MREKITVTLDKAVIDKIKAHAASKSIPVSRAFELILTDKLSVTAEKEKELTERLNTLEEKTNRLENNVVSLKELANIQ